MNTDPRENHIDYVEFPAQSAESFASVKRFYKEGDNIRLQPSNANMDPIIRHASVVQIQGRVIGVLRKY